VRLYLALEDVTQRLAEELVLVGLDHRATVPPRISRTPRSPLGRFKQKCSSRS
jgi:hypothetical protein